MLVSGHEKKNTRSHQKGKEVTPQVVLRIVTGKKHPQIKLQRFQKV